MRKVRKILIGILGGAVLLLGVAMIFLPGPAILIIPAGLAILATEFAWAQRWLHRVRGKIQEFKAKRATRKAARRAAVPR